MKKILLIAALIFSLALSVSGLQYYPIVFDAAGINLNAQPMNIPASQYSKLDNFYITHDRESTERIGVITKIATAPAVKGAMPDSGRQRGLYQFYPNTASSSLYSLLVAVCTTEYSDGTMFELDWANNTWKTLTASTGAVLSYSPYHFTFEQQFDPFREVDTAYMANGDTFRKWFTSTSDDAVAPQVSDIGGTISGLTGSVTFTDGSKIVTGSGTAFESEAWKGRWIASATSETWYEVDYVTSETWASLRIEFDGTTTTEPDAIVAPLTSLRPVHLLIWKSRLWLYDFFAGGGYSRLWCSAAISSVTPAALEDFSGSDTGWIQVPGYSPYGTALAKLNDYIFAFKDNSYVVYRYNSSFLPPIEQVNEFSWGCPAPRTIHRVDDALVYYTGTDVRMTNGFQDISIAADIKNYLQYPRETPSPSSFVGYYGLTQLDNDFPSANYNEYFKQYTLHIPDGSTKITKSLTYDFNKGFWIGLDEIHQVGVVIDRDDVLSAVISTPTFVKCGTGESQLYEQDIYVGDITVTGEVISADLTFGDAKKLKKVEWVEFWLHIGEGLGATTETEVTFYFDFYKDGVQQLTTPKSATVKTAFDFVDTTSNNNNLTKVRFSVNTQCTFFKWRLRDAVYAGTQNSGATSIVGGVIGYSLVTGN